MYDKLKKLLLIFSFLLISLIGILFINANSSEIFGGFRDVVVVEKSPIDFPKAVEDFVASNDITLARRIVDSVDDSNGQLQNTYVPIGNQPLPKGLKQQTDNELIENSSYNTVYVIVSGLMDANEVAKGLSQLKAKVRVLPTNYEIALFRLLITTPQSFLIILGLLIAYISLIFTKHIASMKEVGILRISGKGKHVIALEETKRDSMFILCLTIICVLGISGVLFLLNIFSILALSIVLVPLLSWASLIFLINFCLSHIFYYILQHQPIILSIKGKAPVGLIFLMTTIIQLFTLFSVMYCFHGMILMTKEVDLLKTGRNFWQDNVTFYEMTSLEDGGSITQTQKEIFFKELRDSSTIIYRNDMLDSIALSSNKGKKVYEPTPDLTSNVIYVNENYINENHIILSKNANSFLHEMETYDKMILIPSNQKENFDRLKEKWLYFEERGFLPKNARFENPHPNSKMNAFLYDGGDVFTYPVYSQIGRQYSNRALVHDPIIIVEKPNYALLPTSTLLVNNPKKVMDLIRKHHLTAAFGSLTNGLLSIETKINTMQTRKYILMVSTAVSIFSSFLLFILMNSIYFYQGRRTHFLERLAGKGALAIHKSYLMMLCTAYILIAVTAFFAVQSHLVALVPVGYLFLLLLVFMLQLASEKRANVLYLKGG